MLDPILYDLMHGVGLQGKSNISTLSNVKKDPLELALDQAIKDHVNLLIADEFHPDNKLLTPGMKRAKLEQEVRDAASFPEFNQHLSLAINILRIEGKGLLEKEEFNLLMEGLDTLSQRLDILNLNELNDAVLQSALTIPSDCGNYILKIGIDKYVQEQLKDSLAIFIFLTMVNPSEPDYWFRLGLVAKKCENFTLALCALNSASELAPEFVGSHVYAAHCHLKMRSFERAKTELAEAKKIIDNSQVEEKWHEHINDVENLLKISDFD